MTHPKHPATAKTGPPPFSELLPATPPGWQHMPPSIRDAHTLLNEHEVLTETERSTLTPDDVDNWLAAMMVILGRYLENMSTEALQIQNASKVLQFAQASLAEDPTGPHAKRLRKLAASARRTIAGAVNLRNSLPAA